MIFKSSSQYKIFGPESLQGSTSHGWLSDIGDVNGWVEVDFGKDVSSFVIQSGFHEFPDREDWGWHARPKRIKLDDGTEHLLKDVFEPQTIRLNSPRSVVRLDITDIYPGTRYNVVGIKRIS